MTIAFEIWVGDLLTEFLANAFILFRPLQATGTIAACASEPFFDSFDHFLILVESYCQSDHILFLSLYLLCQAALTLCFLFCIMESIFVKAVISNEYRKE